MTELGLRNLLAQRPTARVVFSSAAGQAVVILATPILTRAYAPREFGVLAVVTAIAAVVGAITGLRLDMAIPIEVDERAAAGVGWASVLSCLVLAGPLAAISLAIYTSLTDASDIWTMPILALTSSSACLIGLTAIATRWLGRRRDYRGMSWLMAAQGWLQSAAQLLLQGVSHGLLLGLPAGRLPSVAVLFLPKSKSRMPWPGWRCTTGALIRFRRFPLISSWGSLVNAAGLQMPAMLLAGLAGPAVAGTFMVSQRLLATPTVLVAQAISEVNYSELSYIQRATKKPIAPLLQRTIFRLALLSVPLFGSIAVLAPFVAEWLLGDAWSNAGVFVSALSLGMAAQFIVIPVSRTLLLLERQGLQTLWEVARLAAVTSILLFMNSVGADPAHSLLALSVVQVLIYGTLLMLILKAAVAHDAKRATQLEPGALGQSISVE